MHQISRTNGYAENGAMKILPVAGEAYARLQFKMCTANRGAGIVAAGLKQLKNNLKIKEIPRLGTSCAQEINKEVAACRFAGEKLCN